MNIVPFDSAKVPSAITAMFGNTPNDLVGSATLGGFPVVSIKGKVFHIQRGDERTLVTKPGEDDPASSIEVVIVKANPNNSKVFYASGFQEGEKAKPTCYSNDGVSPAADAQEPQAKKCATCAHNQWGARITADGRKAKACADSRRIAIATVDCPNDPMLVRVPAASLKNLVEYGKMLQARGLPPQAVVTKIGFDYAVAHPALTFKPVGLINDQETLAAVKKAGEGEIAAAICGMAAPKPTAAEAPPADEGDEDTPAPAPAPKAAKPAPTPKPAAVEAAVAAAEAAPKVKVKVEEAPKPAPTAGLEADISNMLDGMDFDD